MSSLVLNGDTSGSVTVTVPAVAGTNTVTFPAATGTPLVSGAQPTFAAYANTNQTVSSGTFTKVQFQAKEWDTASAFDNTTNYRFQPQIAGYYQLNSTVTTNAVNQTRMITIFFKNGSTYRNGNDNNSGCYGLTMSSMVYLNGSTDYVEVYVYLATTGALQGTVNGTSFQGSLVRAA